MIPWNHLGWAGFWATREVIYLPNPRVQKSLLWTTRTAPIMNAFLGRSPWMNSTHVKERKFLCFLVELLDILKRYSKVWCVPWTKDRDEQKELLELRRQCRMLCQVTQTLMLVLGQRNQELYTPGSAVNIKQRGGTPLRLVNIVYTSNICCG